ncbi:MAG TPA: hypothetical protein VK892_14665 [Pyrinomonadaceae bacterium]|nr:hypothetical protein [Pyrinomonadaceae bacterium]
MSKLFRIVPWIILLIPFILLSFFYNSIGEEVLVYRSFDGNQNQFAPKSLFTVFRVPLIEIVCALMIEIMRRKAFDFETKSQSNYYLMWSILLFAVALKSLLQSLEFISSSVFQNPYWANFFFYTTFAIVIGGIILAFIEGRKLFINFNRQDWKINIWEKIGLASLFLIYVYLAFAPMFIY